MLYFTIKPIDQVLRGISGIMRITSLAYIACVFIATAMTASCDRSTPAGQNLLYNGSFEEVKSGLPVGWEIKNFRGLADMKEATWGVDDEHVKDGGLSFYFDAEKDTKRFFTLTQELEVKDVKNIRVRGWVKTVGVEMEDDQYPQAGMGVTYYNKFRGRYDSARWADARTEAIYGSTDDWKYIDVEWRLPDGVAFVQVHCILGMSGRITFDKVTVEVPEGLPWNEHKGEIFTHYWLDENPYPEGVFEFQDIIYKSFAERLGITPENLPTVTYYFYPSAGFLKDALGLSAEVNIKVDYSRREIHSVNPAEEHEVVHLLTDSFGRLPKALGEGTAYYLMDNYNGKPIQPQAQKLLLGKMMPPLKGRHHPLCHQHRTGGISDTHGSILRWVFARIRGGQAFPGAPPTWGHPDELRVFQ